MWTKQVASFGKQLFRFRIAPLLSSLMDEEQPVPQMMVSPFSHFLQLYYNTKPKAEKIFDWKFQGFDEVIITIETST